MNKILLLGYIAIVFSEPVLAQKTKIAIVSTMSGPVAQYGKMQLIGARQAIADINAKGGINGDRVIAVEYDDFCDPKEAVAIANKVINDGINYVIGHLCSSSTQAASDIYENEGIIMITPATTNTTLTTRGYQLVMRTTGIDSDQGSTAAKYIIEHIKPNRIAIVHDKQEHGEELARSVRENLNKSGLKEVMFEGVTSGDKDFSVLVTKLKKENIDFVYFGGYYPEMGQIIRQAKEFDLNICFMGPESVANSSLSNIAGNSSEGMLVTLPQRYDLIPENKLIVDAIKSKKEDPTGSFIWTTYAAIQGLKTAIDRTGRFEPEALAKDLKSIPINTVMGKLTWKPNGDLKNFKFTVFKWHANGTSTAVK